MSRWSDAFVRRALALTPPGRAGTGRPLPSYTAISTDSRTLTPESLFVALRGPRFDGHDYLHAAADRGATGAVVRIGTAPIPGVVLYVVPDTMRALGDLAAAARQQVSGPVVAVTGTNGKTSTKEMIAAVVRTRFHTHATHANLNNLIGVPLTILRAAPGTEALVVEAGANEPGELARHREIIDPTITVVTNVGTGHLEGFGSTAAVLREKLELVRGVSLAVVGTAPPALADGARPLAVTTCTAGLGSADVTPDEVVLSQDGRPMVRVEGQRFTLPLPGLHLAANAMLAWAVVQSLDLDRSSAARALEGVVVPDGRGQVMSRDGLTIVNDAYNANPDSFAAAIDLAQSIRGTRPLVFVAGTMLELGQQSEALHEQVAQALVELDPAVLAVVGEFVPACARYRDRLGSRLVTASDPEHLGPKLGRRLRGDELIFLKASRGVALERILPYLLDRSDPRR